MDNDMLNIQGELFGASVKDGVYIPDRGHRAEFRKHLHEFDPKIEEMLRTGKLHVTDRLIYSIKPIGNSQTIKMFESSDDKHVGLRSLAAAKMPKNEVMLVSGIYLLAGIAPAANAGNPTKDEIMGTEFGSIGESGFGAIVNGESELKSNKNVIMQEGGNRVFVTDFQTSWPLGYYKLHNPRPIHDDVTIEFTLELGTTHGLPQDAILYVGLYGSGTTP